MNKAASLILCSLLLQACASSRVERQESSARPGPVPIPSYKPTPDPQAEQKLQEANDLYDRGEYAKVAALLSGSREAWNGTLPQRLQAHKLLAFSYCLTRRQASCEQQFGAALRLDPSFDLRPAERNHPQWGPAFEKAKGSVLVQAERPAIPPRSAPAQPQPSGAGPAVRINVNPSPGMELPSTVPLY